MQKIGKASPRHTDTLRELHRHADPQRARILQGFFKTGPGEYGEGDRFLGLTVPIVRRIAREYRELPLAEVLALLKSELHEARLLAVVLLVLQYQAAKNEPARREAIYRAYLRSRARINNWDLIDVSAQHVVGAWLFEHRELLPLLDKLVRSPRLWDRRLAMLSTFYFIREGEHEPALRLARTLLGDEHDLMHKAAGWMLREIGNRDREAERRFLDRHAHEMPRTMLRYAIEKLSPAEKQRYLAAARLKSGEPSSPRGSGRSASSSRKGSRAGTSRPSGTRSRR